MTQAGTARGDLVNHTFVARWFSDAPANRPATLRILVGSYALLSLAVRLGEISRTVDRDPVRFEPVGPLSMLDAPLDPTHARLGVIVVLALGAAFVAGWRFRISGPLFAVGFLLVTNYLDSWGQIFHTDNLAALHLLVLGFTRSSDAWSLDARAIRRRRPPPATGYGWPPRLMSALVAVTYLLAGIAKLRLGGTAWLDGEVLRNQVAFDNVRKALVGDVWSPVARVALDHAWLFTPFALLTLVVELSAPIALMGGSLRRAWAASAWAFHVGIFALMAIVFAYPLTGIAFACFFPVERTAVRIAETVARRRAQPRRRVGVSSSARE